MAIKAIKNISTIFLGGQDRGYSFSKLQKVIRDNKIKNIVLFPDSGAKIIKSKKGLNIFETRSMKEAVRFAFKYTEAGKVCLLSCASPSYSVWKNFEEKGNQFQAAIKKSVAKKNKLPRHNKAILSEQKEIIINKENPGEQNFQ
jgi:UDP-N-acetylmuramoylalanine--D-glutamate ligase